MPKSVFMGIDTSNYTTSVALIDQEEKLIANLKRPLHVENGVHGLRQSDAVFSHIKNLPDIMREAKVVLQGRTPIAVGVSEKPRRVEGSYMPCFLTGVAAAESICAACSVPLFRFSHQCGHLMAALYSSSRYDLFERAFAAFHVSGGTTEMLRVAADGDGFSANCIGGTKDLHAGQVIDRVGVYMGLSFPCGPAMEKLALSYQGKISKKKPPVDGFYANISGLENMAKKLYDETGDAALTSAFVFDYLSDTLVGLTRAYIQEFGQTSVLYAGGVMSNAIIKKNLSKEFDCAFAEPALSADNAVGIAVLAKRAYESKR